MIRALHGWASANRFSILLKHDFNRVSIRTKHTLQEFARTLPGGLSNLQFAARLFQLFPRALEQRITIGSIEGIPESALFIVGLHLGDLDSVNAWLREGDRNAPGFFINLDGAIAFQVDSGKDLPGYNYERPFC